MVTGNNVVLSLYLTFDKVKNIKDEKIVLDYDAAVFDAGFTDDGTTIHNKDFIIDKKYFKDQYYTLSDNDPERKTKYEVIVKNDEKKIIINKFMIKCKQTITDNKQIKFLNKKK